MNGEIFFEWIECFVTFKGQCCNCYVQCFIPFSQASTGVTRKADIIKWLKDKDKVIDKPKVIAQLMTIVKRIKPLNYICNRRICQTIYKNILRLPSYHWELNPIEMAWSSVKNHVKMNNSTFELTDVRRLLEEGVDHVNADMWKNFVRHVIDEEEKFWDMDFMIDHMLAEREALTVTYTGDTIDDLDEFNSTDDDM